MSIETLASQWEYELFDQYNGERTNIDEIEAEYLDNYFNQREEDQHGSYLQ